MLRVQEWVRVEIPRCNVASSWNVFTWVFNPLSTTGKSVGGEFGEYNWDSKDVLTPELSYLYVLFVFLRREVNVWCLAQD